MTPAWVFLALLAAERMVEVALARRNERIVRALGAVETGAALTAVITAFHAAWFLAFAAEILLRRPEPPLGPVPPFAALLILQAARYRCIAALGARWNIKVLTVPGLPPVTSGPYRFLRHPNYVVVALETALYPALLGCFLTALLATPANLLLLRARIRQEDRALGR